MFALTYRQRALNDFWKLDASVAERIQNAISTKLTRYPEHFGKPLGGSLSGSSVLRVGEWRVLFKIRGNEVVIITVRHRKKGYADLA